ncbi:MAG: DNA-binding protein [Nitrososphaerota archaeon]|jgi:rRNA-processing protein FCF1|uniref:type II toxin-antitoxin system VapC family toxin n=1 Tax=Candidatus Bathycorpusculum sp. TaxID=2994959 RepID=UPI002833BE39|nr:DNA-binding protein [Candidatus Termiticorpusculum sp.]MCL2257778.1 DNA-binding protein [Candidatus Termiticorpusculum sp.]MCL2292082.1 DNA-binding protein [Candidatus Termiticorpusculum sp.]MDR0460317.1 DNA-binding protein [Nitrososphaerota archaeon]
MSKTTTQLLKIIIDSNALFTPLELKIDIFEELQCLLNRNIECIVIHPVKAELELLANKDSFKLRRQASFALRLAVEKCKIVQVDISNNSTTDDAIVKVAKSWNTPVFTNDRQLRKRLRDISLPVIYVRQKARLEIDGLIS